MPGFMHPWFAVAGLLALSVPMWVHMYQRQARKKVPISSLRLVPDMPRVTRQRKRLQHWVVFCTRALGVVLLSLAFARPGWSDGEKPSGQRREALVLILDRTASMQSRFEEDGTAWEEAVRIAREQLSALSGQSRVLLLTVPSADAGGERMAEAR